LQTGVSVETVSDSAFAFALGGDVEVGGYGLCGRPVDCPLIGQPVAAEPRG